MGVVLLARLRIIIAIVGNIVVGFFAAWRLIGMRWARLTIVMVILVCGIGIQNILIDITDIELKCPSPAASTPIPSPSPSPSLAGSFQVFSRQNMNQHVVLQSRTHGLPVEDIDFMNSDAKSMNKIMSEANPRMTLFTCRVAEKLALHLRFFKQVLAYAQQSKECANYEMTSLNERMQEYQRQVDREARSSNGSSTGAVMQSAAKVQSIRQGYLSKRSSNLRGDWKRRFSILDSRGMLYYYRKPWNWSSSLGNVYVNSVWEEVLDSESRSSSARKSSGSTPKSDRPRKFLARKPGFNDPISVKELFIHAKYSERNFVRKAIDIEHSQAVFQEMWENVRANDKKSVYRHIVCSEVDVNALRGQAMYTVSLPLAKMKKLEEKEETLKAKLKRIEEEFEDIPEGYSNSREDERSMVREETSNECSLLHLARSSADIGMVELLLQYGAKNKCNRSDSTSSLYHQQEICNCKVATYEGRRSKCCG